MRKGKGARCIKGGEFHGCGLSLRQDCALGFIGQPR
jgi:hypothetical protein